MAIRDRIRNYGGNPDKKINSKRRKDGVKKAAMNLQTHLEKFFKGLRPNTKRRYESVLKDFIGFTGTWEGLTEQDVFDFYDTLIGRDYSGHNVQNTMYALNSMFEYLRKRGFISRNPFDSAAIRLPHKDWNRKREALIVPFDQVLNFCAAPSRFTRDGIRDRAFLALLFGGGLRISEAQNLRCGDVRALTLDEGVVIYVILAETKSGRAQEQALPFWAAERVLRLLEQRHSEGCRPEDSLITNYRLKMEFPTNGPIPIRTLTRIFHKYRKVCGLKNGITPHSARKTAISRLIDLKVPIRDVQKFARHSSVAVTEGYIKLEKTLAESPALDLKYG